MYYWIPYEYSMTLFILLFLLDLFCRDGDNLLGILNVLELLKLLQFL